MDKGFASTFARVYLGHVEFFGGWALDACAISRAESCGCKLQQLISSGVVSVVAVSGHSNPEDIGAKRLSRSRMRSLMAVLGIYTVETQHARRHDGRILVPKYRTELGDARSTGEQQRSGEGQEKWLLCLATLVSALGLLQLHGCDPVAAKVDTSWLAIFFTVLLGLMFLLPWMWSQMCHREVPMAGIQNDVQEPVAATHFAGAAQEDDVQELVAITHFAGVAQSMNDGWCTCGSYPSCWSCAGRRAVGS
eukprot:s2813_g10.t1